MELSLALLGGLAVLALIDSTSVGTLVVPVWLLSSSRPIALRRMVVYLGVVSGFYLLVGLLLLLGLDGLRGVLAEVGDLRPARAVQLVAGVGLLGWAVFGASRKDASARPGRLSRWRERATGDGPIRGLVVLALTVTTIELAMMLPYLAAIGTLTLSDAPLVTQALVLVGYCLVMVAPALVLTLARRLARRRVDPVLARLEAWTTRNAAELTGWIVGLVGFYVAANAAQALDIV